MLYYNRCLTSCVYYSEFYIKGFSRSCYFLGGFRSVLFWYHYRVLSIRCGPFSGPRIYVKRSPPLNDQVGSTTSRAKWSRILWTVFKRFISQKMEGRNFAQKMETVLACLMSNRTESHFYWCARHLLPRFLRGSRFLDYFVGNGWLLHACWCRRSKGSSGMNSINIMCHRFIRTNAFSMLKILEQPLVHNFDLNSSGGLFFVLYLLTLMYVNAVSRIPLRGFQIVSSCSGMQCWSGVFVGFSLMTDNSELLLILNNFRCFFCRLFCIFVSFIKKFNSSSHNAFDWCLHSSIS